MKSTLEPGKLYSTSVGWYVFPDKETAKECLRQEDWDFASTLGGALGFVIDEYNATYIGPSSFLVLESDNLFIKIVGDKVGWIAISTHANWITEIESA